LQFTQVDLTEIIRQNIELANYTKPTPVQVREDTFLLLLLL